jgi:hypothetical protein
MPAMGASTAAALVVAVLLLAGCSARPTAAAPSSYPDPLVPGRVLDQYDLERRPEVEAQYAKPGRAALVTEGRVFTIRGGDTIEGSLQIALFRRDVDTRLPSVRRGIEGDFGSPEAFRTEHFGTVKLRVLTRAEERIYLWFPPDRNVMELFVMRKKFADAERVVHGLITFQRTETGET